MNLRQVFDILNITLPVATQDAIQESDFDHFGFGRWMRNICKFWEDGTDEIVADILRLPNHSTYTSEYVLPGQLQTGDVDNSLEHPDNCSHVVFMIYKDYLNKKIAI